MDKATDFIDGTDIHRYGPNSRTHPFPVDEQPLHKINGGIHWGVPYSWMNEFHERGAVVKDLYRKFRRHYTKSSRPRTLRTVKIFQTTYEPHVYTAKEVQNLEQTLHSSLSHPENLEPETDLSFKSLARRRSNSQHEDAGSSIPVPRGDFWSWDERGLDLEEVWFRENIVDDVRAVDYDEKVIVGKLAEAQRTATLGEKWGIEEHKRRALVQHRREQARLY